MAKIVDQFLQYLESIENQFENSDVDLTSLIEKTKFSTPIPLKYSDPQTAIRNMSSVIVQNLCKCSINAKYPKYGLNAIKRVITKNLDDEDSQAQLMLLVHITKMNLSIQESAHYCKRFERMSIKTEDTDQLNAWKDVAYKVLTHSEINNTINDLMKRSFGNQYSQRIVETESIKVSIKFVDTTEPELRGFAGINCVYINEFYFRLEALILNQELSTAEKENILLMNIVTVTLHEYAHVRIRQVLDDLNISSPELFDKTAIAADDDAADPEFGRIVERKFFKVPINWKKSFDLIPMTYIPNFLNAINTNATLPALPENVNVIKRSGPVVMHGGADLSYDHVQSIE